MRKTVRESALRSTSPEGEYIYGVRAIKVCRMILELNLLKIRFLTAVWHRLMMLEVLNEAGHECGGWSRREWGASCCLVLNIFLESYGGFDISLQCKEERNVDQKGKGICVQNG